MKKFKKISAAILMICLMTCISVSTCFASGTINTLEAADKDNTVVFTGTTSNDVLAVSLMIYDKSGTNLVKIVSGAVDDNHTYAIETDLAKDTYLVKVADYAGGTFLEKMFTIGSNPGTGLNESNPFWLVPLCAAGLLLTLFLIGKKKKITDQ